MNLQAMKETLELLERHRSLIEEHNAHPCIDSTGNTTLFVGADRAMPFMVTLGGKWEKEAGTSSYLTYYRSKRWPVTIAESLPSRSHEKEELVFAEN